MRSAADMVDMVDRVERVEVAARRRATGFTLVELTVSLVIMVTIAALSLPYLTRNGTDRVTTAAELLQADIRYARLSTMSNPQDPIVVRFTADGKGYYLAKLSAPNVAITRADTNAPFSVTMGADRARYSANVSMALTSIPGAMLQFTPLGAVQSPAGTPKVTFTSTISQPGVNPYYLEVDPSTGSTSMHF